MRASDHLRLAVLVLLLGTVLASIPSFGQEGAPSTEGAAQAGGVAQNVAGCSTYAAGDPSLELVSKLCDFALSYRQRLPDFIVEQKVTSEGTYSKSVITAQITFENGLEHYSRVAIDGRAAPVSRITSHLPNEIRFSSTGEFGPALLDLFRVPGAIEFKFAKNSTLRNQPVAVYDFRLPEKKNVSWTFRIADGRTFRPEFTGELWLNRQTGLPLREEMEPVNLPASCDITSAKTVIDYAMTAVGHAGSFLLPSKSETTVCDQGIWGIGACTTNTLVFHGYRKFGADTRILPSASRPQ